MPKPKKISFRNDNPGIMEVTYNGSLFRVPPKSCIKVAPEEASDLRTLLGGLGIWTEVQ